MKKLNHKQLVFGIFSAVLTVFMIAIGPADVFVHGYYSEKTDMDAAVSDMNTPIDLSQGDYEMHFSPAQNHFAGIEIFLTNQPDNNRGFLELTIKDKRGAVLETAEVNLSKVKNHVWYKTYVSARLEQGQNYTLLFSAKNCETVPSLVALDKNALGEETIDGNAALAYAYKKSTFDFPTKILILLFAISLWLWFFVKVTDIACRRILQTVSLIIFMTGIMGWNYMYSSMDNGNRDFEDFQKDSEGLVTSAIAAEEDGVWFYNSDDEGFGLGKYFDKREIHYGHTPVAVTDEDAIDGYARSRDGVVVLTSSYIRFVIQDLAAIRFSTGEVFRVTETVENKDTIHIGLETDERLYPETCGELKDITFIDSQGNDYMPPIFAAYKSQYGLQGKVFRHIARRLNDDTESDTLRLLCSLSTALIFSVIVLLLAVKYDYILAFVFFLVFWLSPWIVNFARNLYWVEFTWFFPMAAGLFCAWKIENRTCRIISYAAAFVSIAAKCLCGYEYISSVMMGLIAFPLVDFTEALVKKDTEKARLLFRTVFILGVMALTGFAAAVCMHASLKADGDLLKGIQIIFEEDVLRRTSGGDLNEFSESYWESFNASVWEVYCKYFKFSTEIVTGIAGNLFPLLCCLPLAIFVHDYRKENLNVKLISMYTVFFLTAVSWFCLAKAHSCVHTHMNYVLWYFGFVQICFYTIVNKIKEMVSQSGNRENIRSLLK